MRILIDFRKYAGIYGGVEQVIVNIAKFAALKGNKIFLMVCEKRIKELKPQFVRYKNIELIPLNTDNHSMTLKNLLLDSNYIQKLAVKKHIDLIHFTYNWSFPFNNKIPSILTIHDIIPSSFREAMGFFENKLIYKPGIRLACNLNNKITTISNYSKRDLINWLKISPKKIIVIPNGVRKRSKRNKDVEVKLLKKYRLQNGFILNVGGLHERKNVPRLIIAFGRLISKHKYLGKLLITGTTTGSPYIVKMKKKCDEVVQKNHLGTKVVFTEFISESELDSLYRTGDLLVYPSLYEGFGLPILEAMNTKIPVITSNITATKEVAKGAALLVNPYNINDITNKMQLLLTNKKLKATLIKNGLKKVKEYTLKKSIHKYLELYKKIAQ